MFVIYLGFLIMIIDWKIYFNEKLPFLQIEKFLNYKIMSQSKIIFGSTVNFYSEWVRTDNLNISHL